MERNQNLTKEWSDLLHPDDYDWVMDGIGLVYRDTSRDKYKYRLNVPRTISR